MNDQRVILYRIRMMLYMDFAQKYARCPQKQKTLRQCVHWRRGKGSHQIFHLVIKAIWLRTIWAWGPLGSWGLGIQVVFFRALFRGHSLVWVKYRVIGVCRFCHGHILVSNNCRLLTHQPAGSNCFHVVFTAFSF